MLRLKSLKLAVIFLTFSSALSLNSNATDVQNIKVLINADGTKSLSWWHCTASALA